MVACGKVLMRLLGENAAEATDFLFKSTEEEVRKHQLKCFEIDDVCQEGQKSEEMEGRLGEGRVHRVVGHRSPF